MKTQWQEFKKTFRSGAWAAATVACTLLYACDQNRGQGTEADANTAQDSMNIDTGAGAGHSTDTMGGATAPNDTTNPGMGVGAGMHTTPSSDTIGSQPAGTGNRNTGAGSSGSNGGTTGGGSGTPKRPSGNQ